MAQATSRVNANRVHFSKLERAHLSLVQSLTVLFPHRIVGDADAADIEARADHLRQAHRVFLHYIEAVTLDTMNHIVSDGPVDWVKVEVALFDACNDADPEETIGALRLA